MQAWTNKRKRKVTEPGDLNDILNDLTENVINLSRAHPFLGNEGEDLRAFIERVGPCRRLDDNAATLVKQLQAARDTADEVALSFTLPDSTKDVSGGIFRDFMAAKTAELRVVFGIV